jgi:parallel beta-helix repeat protein
MWSLKGKNLSVFFSILLVNIILLGFTSINSTHNHDEELDFINMKTDRLKITNYISHSPINIFGNNDLINQASAENWIGNGTAEDPYIISGFLIENVQTQIRVQDTDLHFIIKDCNLIGGFSGEGIYLWNVHNIKIVNTIISSNTVGIIIDGDPTSNSTSSYNIIDSNVIFNIQEQGIWIGSSTNNNFSFNIIYESSNGLILFESDNNSIISNNISLNWWSGIILQHSSNNLLKGNYIQNNTIGVEINECCETYPTRSGNNKLIENTIAYNNEHGLQIYGTEFYQPNFWPYIEPTFDDLFGKGSINNTVLYNNFIWNWAYMRDPENSDVIFEQVHNEGENNNFSHNYWDDYPGSDENFDGIGDVPFSITFSPTADPFPLINQYKGGIVPNKPTIEVEGILYFDTDQDSIPDWYEVEHGLNITYNDAFDDHDLDKMPNIWEFQMELNASFNDASDDKDLDGLTNLDEYIFGTSAKTRDTDFDQMDDNYEYIMGLNGTFDDFDLDKDKDSIPNGAEYLLGLSAKEDDTFLDSDEDGMFNVWEYHMGLNLFLNDRELDFDEDGMDNFWEYRMGFNASFNDALEDPDGDWVPNIGEYRAGSNPHDFWNVPIIYPVFPFILSAVHVIFMLEITIMAVIGLLIANLYVKRQQQRFTQRFGAPDYESAKKMEKGKFTEYSTFLKAQELNIDLIEEYEFTLEIQKEEDHEKEMITTNPANNHVIDD